MKKYNGKKELVEMCCNKCGRKIKINGEIITEDALEVTKKWGFFSEKDGIIHSFDMCEKCYDEMISSFNIPVEKKESTEYM